MPNGCCLRELGRIDYGAALELQQQLVADRKQGLIPDQLLLLEHPHVITLGRNGHLENLLAGDDVLDRAGIAFYPTDRGGDITYHGPGQLVGYPILDLREWKRDVGAYVRALEQVDHRHPGRLRHCRRPHRRADRRLGGRPQNRRHRRAHQPLGHFPRFRLECRQPI